MPASSALFYGSLAFLVGVLLASVGLRSSVLLIAAAFAAAFVVAGSLRVVPFERKVRGWWWALTALALLMPIGALYYHFDDARFRANAVPLGVETVTGIVRDDPALREGYRPATVALEGGGRVRANLPPYPEVRYGDRVRLTGNIVAPSPEGYARYLAKERVSGVMQRPQFEILSRGEGSTVQAALYALKRRVVEIFNRALPAEEAAFVAGLTVGERAAFSEEFKEAMQRSGTTHLVALSGYNVSIIVQYLMPVAFWLTRRRRAAFTLTFLAIVGFTLMAGAEASLVRAAIMGSLVLLARESGRLFDMRQAIVLAALAMVVVNPKVLAFDVGFQLSFLALLGIAYLAPAVRRWLGHKEEETGFRWRTMLSETAAAQIAVAPLLVAQFGSVSLTSLIANLAVLWAIPYTMGMGFVVAALGMIHETLSSIGGWFLWIPLRYELMTIRMMSALSLPVAPGVSWFGAFFYYGVITFGAWWTHRRYGTHT